LKLNYVAYPKAASKMPTVDEIEAAGKVKDVEQKK
jgi:hypothetical protein